MIDEAAASYDLAVETVRVDFLHVWSLWADGEFAPLDVRVT